MGTWRGGYVYRGDLALVGLNARIVAARPHPDQPRYGSTGRRAEAECGTAAGARRHSRRGEPACRRCLAAAVVARQLRKARAA